MINLLIAHDTLTFAEFTIIAVLGGLLLGIQIPQNTQWSKLRIARGYLSLSYFILATLSMCYFFTQPGNNNSSLLAVFTLLVASYQALLFTMTLLVLIQPLYVRRKLIINQIFLISTIGLFLLLSFFVWPKTIFPFIIHICIAGYLFQLFYYTRLFRQKYKACLKQLENYYDEDEDNRLKRVQYCFYSALGIGIFALASISFPIEFYNLFIITFTIYYAFVVNLFYNYRINAGFIVSVVTKEQKMEEVVNISQWKEQKEEVIQKEKALKIALEQWVTEKKFTQKDISVIDTVAQLKTDINFFRYYFRTYMQIDFRTWRSELRIREAEQILKENPDISLSQLCEIIGCNDKGNLHRLFNKFTGMTPAEYKQKIISSKNKRH